MGGSSLAVDAESSSPTYPKSIECPWHSMPEAFLLYVCKLERLLALAAACARFRGRYLARSKGSGTTCGSRAPTAGTSARSKSATSSSSRCRNAWDTCGPAKSARGATKAATHCTGASRTSRQRRRHHRTSLRQCSVFRLNRSRGGRRRYLPVEHRPAKRNNNEGENRRHCGKNDVVLTLHELLSIMIWDATCRRECYRAKPYAAESIDWPVDFVRKK